MLKSLVTLVTLLAFLGLAMPAGAQTEAPPKILVEWSPTSAPARLSPPLKGSISSRTFSTPLMRKQGRGSIEVINLPAGTDVNSAVEAYKKLPGVVNVEPNYRYSVDYVSDDTLYTNGSLWGMYSSDTSVVGPSGTTNVFGSQAEQAWNSGYLGSMRTVVGVIDTGVDYTHPDLYLNIYLNQGEIKTLPFFSSLVDTDGDGIITFRDLNNPSNSSRVSDLNSNGRIDGGDLLSDPRWSNGVDDDSNGYVDDLIGWDFVNGDNDPMDDNHHGTHVSGTIGGLGSNSIGVAGINWKVQIMPIKFLDYSGSGYLSDAIQAIDYYTSATSAQDKAFNPSSPLLFIGTNNSWGGGGYSSLLKTSIEGGAQVNNHFVAAAGNSSSNNDSFANYPSNYSTLSVAGWEAVTAVASLNSSGGLSWFSNYGSTTVDLGAPGENIQSSSPGTSYESLSGTSMATPHVAGTLALLASSNPDTNRRNFRSAILSTATSTPSLLGKVVTGGRLDTYSALLSTFCTVTGPASVNEGASIPFSISAPQLPEGSVLYWALSGVQASDISPPNLLGSVTVNGGTASLTFNTVNDNTLEGTEVMLLRLFSDSDRLNQACSTSVSIIDTSNGMTYFWGTVGNDTISGSNNPDFISGVPSSGTSLQSLGKGQVDVVSGKGGADIFILGQVRNGSPRVFYNNNNLATVGSSDYLLITDFNKLVDKVQLVAGRYFTRNSSTNTVIYWDRNNNGVLNLTGTNRDEVISIIRSVNLGNFTVTPVSSPTWVKFSN